MHWFPCVEEKWIMNSLQGIQSYTSNATLLQKIPSHTLHDLKKSFRLEYEMHQEKIRNFVKNTFR